MPPKSRSSSLRSVTLLLVLIFLVVTCVWNLTLILFCCFLCEVNVHELLAGGLVQRLFLFDRSPHVLVTHKTRAHTHTHTVRVTTSSHPHPPRSLICLHHPELAMVPQLHSKSQVDLWTRVQCQELLTRSTSVLHGPQVCIQRFP